MMNEDDMQRKELERLLGTAKDEERKSYIRKALAELDASINSHANDDSPQDFESQDKFRALARSSSSGNTLHPNGNHGHSSHPQHHPVLNPSTQASLFHAHNVPLDTAVLLHPSGVGHGAMAGLKKTRPMSARRQTSMKNLLEVIPEHQTASSTNGSFSLHGSESKSFDAGKIGHFGHGTTLDENGQNSKRLFNKSNSASASSSPSSSFSVSVAAPASGSSAVPSKSRQHIFSDGSNSSSSSSSSSVGNSIQSSTSAFVASPSSAKRDYRNNKTSSSSVGSTLLGPGGFDEEDGVDTTWNSGLRIGEKVVLPLDAMADVVATSCDFRYPPSNIFRSRQLHLRRSENEFMESYDFYSSRGEEMSPGSRSGKGINIQRDRSSSATPVSGDAARSGRRDSAQSIRRRRRCWICTGMLPQVLMASFHQMWSMNKISVSCSGIDQLAFNLHAHTAGSSTAFSPAKLSHQISGGSTLNANRTSNNNNVDNNSKSSSSAADGLLRFQKIAEGLFVFDWTGNSRDSSSGSSTSSSKGSDARLEGGSARAAARNGVQQTTDGRSVVAGGISLVIQRITEPICAILEVRIEATLPS